MKLALAVFAFILPAPALAQCAITEPLLAQAYPNAQQSENGLLVKGGDFERSIQPDDVVCKAWPWRPELMLAAVPLLEAKPADEGSNKGDVEILVTDRAGKPLARRLEPGMAFSDAIRFSDMGLDTARYDVTEGLRAFGLRTTQYGSSRVNPYNEQALWLYTFDKGRIERVLDGLIVERGNGENDGNCQGEMTTVKRTVTLGPKTSARYRALEVEQTETLATSKPTADDCQTDERPGKTTRLDLTYDKGRYRLQGKVDELFSTIEIGER
ncbi:hypothetical protein [Mesorhizobium sp. 1M-11]|uniref:hypothetical protein n=1 Tax=Mesorhizobium sp. 1M-11 TaxID=1529006 RepID=UPI0006C74F2A|nr:hypothetical protein [Mesorhizobium sp. 1M-11]